MLPDLDHSPNVLTGKQFAAGGSPEALLDPVCLSLFVEEQVRRAQMDSVTQLCSRLPTYGYVRSNRTTTSLHDFRGCFRLTILPSCAIFHM